MSAEDANVTVEKNDSIDQMLNEVKTERIIATANTLKLLCYGFPVIMIIFIICFGFMCYWTRREIPKSKPIDFEEIRERVHSARR